MNEQITILIVDDHAVVRMGLAAMIEAEADLVVTSEAEDGTQAIRHYRQHRPDVVLMDLRMPGMSGVEATAAIRRESPDAKIILLSSFDGDEDIYRALQAGAKSYLLKSMSSVELVSAIRAVHAGKRYIPHVVADRLAERVCHAELTPREIEVLQLIAHGRTNKEIAQTLKVAEGTIKSHVINILGKLGVDDRTNATTLALQRGIIHMEARVSIYKDRDTDLSCG